MLVRSPSDRVAANSPQWSNDKIADEMEARISHFARHPEQIEARLRELDKEWDIERALELNAGTIALLGCGLGAFVHKRLFAIPAIVAGFLVQHAIQGWCPPLPLFRALGIRTQREIEEERRALEMLLTDDTLT